MLLEFSHAVISAFAPGLTLERFASWRLSRRLTSALLLAVLFGGMAPRPAQAQTVDWAAFGQRATEFARNAYREVKQDAQWLKQNLSTDMWWTRQLMASYEDYKNARMIYQRVTNPNASINIIQGMPLLEVYGTNSGGDEDVYVLRPVLRPQQRLNPPRLPNLVLPDFNAIWDAVKSGQLDFDLDHFTVVAKSDDANLSPQELARRSIEDAWGNWRQAQAMQGTSIDEALYNIPLDAHTYDQLGIEAQTYLNRRRQSLQTIAEFLSQRGPDDPAYKQALQALAEVEKAQSSGQGTTIAQDVRARLMRIDGQATQVVSIAARLRQAVGEVARRQANKEQNIQTLKSLYKPAQSGVFSFTEWFNKLGTDKKDVNKEQLSASMLANAHAEDIATSASERMKQEFLDRLDHENNKFRELADQKARAIESMRSAMGDAWYADQSRILALEVQQDTAMARLRLLLAKNPSPTGVPVRVPDQLATIPGTIRSSAPPTKDPVEVLTEQLPDKLQARIEERKTALANDPTLRIGIVAPVFQALDAAAKSVFGKSFNLSKWGTA